MATYQDRQEMRQRAMRLVVEAALAAGEAHTLAPADAALLAAGQLACLFEAFGQTRLDRTWLAQEGVELAQGWLARQGQPTTQRDWIAMCAAVGLAVIPPTAGWGDQTAGSAPRPPGSPRPR